MISKSRVAGRSARADAQPARRFNRGAIRDAVSVALGELREWPADLAVDFDGFDFPQAGIRRRGAELGRGFGPSSGSPRRGTGVGRGRLCRLGRESPYPEAVLDVASTAVESARAFSSTRSTNRVRVRSTNRGTRCSSGVPRRAGSRCWRVASTHPRSRNCQLVTRFGRRPGRGVFQRRSPCGRGYGPGRGIGRGP